MLANALRLCAFDSVIRLTFGALLICIIIIIIFPGSIDPGGV